MLSWLLPKELQCFDFFTQHVALAKAAAQEMLKGPDIVKIKEIEHQADQITRQCIEMLRKAFITPFDRNDIFRLISRMDDIIDAIYAAARCYSVYKIQEPTIQFRQLCKIILECVQELELALKELHDLKEVKSISQNCANINRLENDADHLLSQILGHLFERENDIKQLIKWKEIYEHLEAAVDRCEDAANVIEGIILEHT